jgi:hypothetical protein
MVILLLIIHTHAFGPPARDSTRPPHPRRLHLIVRTPSRPSFAASLSLVLLTAGPALGAEDGKDRPTVPHFVEEAGRAGVFHVYAGDFDYIVGGGVAVFDCDADDRPDLYVAGGIDAAALYRNRSRPGGPLRFDAVKSAATGMNTVTGAYPLDIDSDGITDLVVLRHGENVLLRGLGDCAFERANEDWGFDGGDAWTAAFSATWEEGHAWPTLAFGNYVDHFDEQNLAHCSPGALHRPADGDTGFAPPMALEPGQCALSMLFSDWDRSGHRDLRVSNDRHYYYNEGSEQLWEVRPAEAPRLYTAEEGWQTVRIFGMGIAGQDLTGDGRPEYYLTTIGDNRLETLAADGDGPLFENIAFDLDIASPTPWIDGPVKPSTSWHPEFDDVNNDARLDLYISKGNVDAAPDSALKDPNELYLGRSDGMFLRAAREAGLRNLERTRGAALVDLNRDGLLDIVEVNRNANVNLRRNLGRGTAQRPRSMGNWLAVKPQQAGANRDAVGAWVEVKVGEQVTTREVTVGGGHAGGELGPLHFGLGREESAEVRVTWPDGTVGPWQHAPAGRVMRVEREATVGTDVTGDQS